jgi:hypothetical protein
MKFAGRNTAFKGQRISIHQQQVDPKCAETFFGKAALLFFPLRTEQDSGFRKASNVGILISRCKIRRPLESSII